MNGSRFSGWKVEIVRGLWSCLYDNGNKTKKKKKASCPWRTVVINEIRKHGIIV